MFTGWCTHRLKAEVADKKLANAITGYAAKQTGSDLR